VYTKGFSVKITPSYIVDEENRRVAVQLDIETFDRIEETLENYGLYQLMELEEADDNAMDLSDARSYYNSLNKAS
jgi:hypothetical protein